MNMLENKLELKELKFQSFYLRGKLNWTIAIFEQI